MDKKVAEVLRKARAKIEQPEHWCKGFLARDAGGGPRLPRSDAAVAWCVYGAVQAESHTSDIRTKAWRHLDRCTRGSDGPTFNDAKTTTHADILRLFDCAIARAESDA